jgi:hypothetical protein
MELVLVALIGAVFGIACSEDGCPRGTFDKEQNWTPCGHCDWRTPALCGACIFVLAYWW